MKPVPSTPARRHHSRPLSQASWILSAGCQSHPPGMSSPIIDPGIGTLWNFGFTLDGGMEDIREDGISLVRRGDFALMKPGARHGWRVPMGGRPWRVVWFIFQAPPEWLPLLDFPEYAPGQSLVSLAGTKEERSVGRAFAEAYGHWSEGRSLASRFTRNSIERGLLGIRSVADLDGGRDTTDPRLTKAVSYLRRNLAEPLTLDQIAVAAGLSVSRLTVLFTKHLGHTPMSYLEHERMGRAADLLVGAGLSIKEIAFACGYSDQRYFATRFRHIHGHPPSAVRQKG